MNWPQIIILAWMGFQASVAFGSWAGVVSGQIAMKSGKTKTEHTGWFIARLAGIGTMTWLLHAGGFWS